MSNNGQQRLAMSKGGRTFVPIGDRIEGRILKKCDRPCCSHKEKWQRYELTPCGCHSLVRDCPCPLKDKQCHRCRRIWVPLAGGYYEAEEMHLSAKGQEKRAALSSLYDFLYEEKKANPQSQARGTEMTEPTLKPCPFCGETESTYKTSIPDFYGCENCSITGELKEWQDAYCWKQLDAAQAEIKAKDARIAQLLGFLKRADASINDFNELNLDVIIANGKLKNLARELTDRLDYNHDINCDGEYCASCKILKKSREVIGEK